MEQEVFQSRAAMSPGKLYGFSLMCLSGETCPIRPMFPSRDASARFSHNPCEPQLRSFYKAHPTDGFLGRLEGRIIQWAKHNSIDLE